jgi:fructosamine-3-kinase
LINAPEVERAISTQLGRPWKVSRVTDLSERASHPCGIFHGDGGFAVFAKMAAASETEQFVAELKGLNLIRRLAGLRTPVPIGDGVVQSDRGCLLLLEAIPEVPPEKRTDEQWRSLGRALAALHRVHDERFGLEEFDGYFGPLRQDNRPVGSNRWADFFAQRRLAPGLRLAVDSGNLPPDLAAGIERLIRRLPHVCGPEPAPTLIHGDAQQNNFLTAEGGQAVLFDAAPYFGHPELDLALIDYFEPVPAAVFDGYRELATIDPGFGDRRELWRLHGYLAVIAVDGASSFGRPFVGRIARTVRTYA